jgi:hypothetical protein
MDDGSTWSSGKDMMSRLGSQQEISSAVMTPSGSSMTQTLISPDHRHGLQEGTTGGRNRAFERRACEKERGSLFGRRVVSRAQP